MLADPPAKLRDKLAAARSFVDTEIEPLEPEFIHAGFGAVAERLDELRGGARRLGLWTPQLPREAGGGGLDLVEFAHLAEVLGRSPIAHYVFNCQAPDAGNMEILLEFGSDEQRRDYLEPLVAGEIRSWARTRCGWTPSPGARATTGCSTAASGSRPRPTAPASPSWWR
jgi:alkylation response protein AidB-like acyl-CoA dehydrogenase